MSFLSHETIGNPFGIQPIGNLYWNNGKNSRGNMGYFGILSDSFLVEWFSCLDDASLVKLAKTCRALYCITYHEDVWRTKVLNNKAFNFQESWHRTYTKSTFSPLKTEFYSDFLYTYWRCTLVPLESLSGSVDNIERVSGISKDEFISRFAIPNKPVILQDVVTKWPAYEKWNTEFLKTAPGTFICEGIELTMEQYLNYMTSSNEESPLYLFDKGFANNELLGKDFKVPEYFTDDLFQGLPNRPDYRWLIIGPARSGSTFHKDPNSTSAWNAVIRGRKKWILLPPHSIPPGVMPSKDGSQVTTPFSVIEWFLNYYPQVNGAIECICEEGELMFIPNGWWHCVLNLSDSIAITQNFVCKENLKNVLEFLSEKKDQVSGYCGGDLYSDFVATLDPSLIPPKKQSLFTNDSFSFTF